jgi:hypothetical protein
MKIIVDIDNVVIFCGSNEHRIERTNMDTTIWKGNASVILSMINDSNSKIYEVEDELVPSNVVQRYKYDGKVFSLNNQFRDNTILPKDFNLSIIDLPEICDDNALNRKIEQHFSMLKYFNGEGITINQNLLLGIELLNTPDDQLTEFELRNKNIATNYKNKLRARFRIAMEVDDLPDQIANTDKQLQLITSLLLRLYANVMLQREIPKKVKDTYDYLITETLDMFDSGEYKDRTDYENAVDLFQRISNKNVRVGTIVNDEYLTKKIKID